MVILTLLRRHKERILAILAVLASLMFVRAQVIAYGDQRYQDGMIKADQLWTDTWNKGVELHNSQVDDLKAESRKAQVDVQKRAAEREAKLNKILKDLRSKTNLSRPSDWVPSKDTVCGSGDSVAPTKLLYAPEDGLLTVPLGATFVDTWNKINATALPQEKKSQPAESYEEQQSSKAAVHSDSPKGAATRSWYSIVSDTNNSPIRPERSKVGLYFKKTATSWSSQFEIDNLKVESNSVQ